MSTDPQRQPGQSSAQSTVRAEDLFSGFMRNLPGLAWLKHLDGTFAYANEAALRAFAPGLADITGMTNADLLPPEVASQCDASDAQALTGSVEVIESYVDAEKGARITLVNKFPIMGPDGHAQLVGAIAIDITERKQAEEKQRDSEERLRLATAAGNIGVWEWDIPRDQVTWSSVVYELHGVKPDEFDGKVQSFAKLTHPDDRERVLQAIDTALARDDFYEIEFRAVRPDNSIVWIYTHAKVVRENGLPIRMMGAILDITDRKNAELALRKSEERFAKAFNSSPLTMTLSSLRTGKLLEVNDTFVTLSGYSREEAIGRTTLELGSWDNTTERESELNTVRLQGKVRNVEYRFRTRSGEVKLGLLSAERIDVNDEPCTLTIIEDITERDKAQRALRDSEERLRLALRGANAGVWTLDVRTGQLFWSDEYCALYGYGPDTVPKLDRWRASIHPDDREAMDLDFEQRLHSRDTDFRQEFRIVHPTLGVRWILNLGRIERDTSGAARSFSGINLDSTDRKQMEEELRQSDRRKNEFLATLAHELRNPLAPVRNGLEILRLTKGVGDAAEQARTMMDRQLRQMVRLIDDLLDLSRISRGQIELRLEDVELTEAIRNAVEISQPLINQHRHELSLDLPADSLMVHADQTRLSQLLANLLNNAAKYTEDGGKIRVQVKRDGAHADICVRDTGIGIPAHQLARVFEMFAQGDMLDRSQGGLGIGLHIAKRLVEMHSGTLTVLSDGPGTGSEFTVRLPLHKAQPIRASATQSTSAATTTALRILIADDNADAASSLAMMLKLKGNEVRTARDGAEAVAVAKVFLPEIVLLDIGMPVLNGYEACRQLRAQFGAKVKIVALTGWGQKEDIERSQEAGFDHHLVKPVGVDSLEALLNESKR